MSDEHDELDTKKVNEIKKAFETLLEELREKYRDHPREINEAFKAVSSEHLEGREDWDEDSGDPNDPYGSGVNKGP